MAWAMASSTIWLLAVGCVQADEGVADVHGYARGQAGGDAEHPGLAAGAWQVPGVEGGDGGGPVDVGHWRGGVGDADAGLYEVVAEVAPVQPGGVVDDQLAGGFGGVEAAGAGTERGSQPGVGSVVGAGGVHGVLAYRLWPRGWPVRGGGRARRFWVLARSRVISSCETGPG